ncbi:MAG TPA: hypothetical protein VNB03_14260, partial [Casimicrobiaceae bacterium]|nr:hypothetical protein [Casimicrobiaceae bacterium]
MPFKLGVMLHDGGSGAAQLFLQVESGLYLALHGPSDTLEKVESGWLLRRPDGSTQRFDANGYLVEARDRFANGYRVEYEPTPLYSLYQLHCAQGRPLRGEKACAMLDYAFGKSHPRRFVHDGTYAYRETRMYEEWVLGPSAARAMARSDLLDGGAEDDLVRRLRLRVGRDLLVRVRPPEQNDLDLYTQRDFDAETRLVKAVLVDVANAIIEQRDLYAQRGLAPAQLGRATRPIFDALRSDGIFTNDAGTLKTAPNTAELRRIANFNLGLVSEVLYPDIFRTWHEYPNHPTIEAATHADNAPVPAVGATEESSRIARRTWYNTAYRLLRLYLESPVEPTRRTRHATDGGHTHRPVRVIDDFGRELVFEYYESELGTGREAGLLKAVIGPAGTRVQFAYHRPSWYPHYLNEMFLVRVDRADAPVVPLPTFEGLVASPPRGYRFESAWERPDAEKVLFEWAWVVWRGPTNAGSRSAALAAGHYVSTIADNIVRVRRVAGPTTVVESETAYIFHPLNHAFDRVAAQRHGGSETQAAGSDYMLDGQRLITWATGLPQTTFSWAHPNYRRTWDFLPAPIRTQYRAEAVPHRIPLDYNFEYFTGPAEESDTPAILRSYNSCEQIRGASTSYAGLDVHYDADRQRYWMDYQDRSHPGVLTKVAIDATRQRARLDGRRACAWVRVVDREGVASFYGIDFRGNVLIRAIEEQPAPRLLYALEETLYMEDGQPREMRRPTLNQRWAPREGGHRLSYQGAATLQGPEWRGKNNLVRVVETPRGSSRVNNWSVDGQARDAVARFATYAFEPVYNQVVRIRRGTIDEQQNERAHTQLDYLFCPDGNPDPPANGGNGNACAQLAPVTLRSGPPPPSPLRRTTQFEWTPAGQPAVIAAQDGGRVEYAYYAALGLPPIPLPALPPGPVLPVPGIGPPAPPPSSRPSHPEREASRANRGFLARAIWSRFDPAYPAALGPPEGFCSALRGPYQWLLPSTCTNPRDELRALGLPNVAVNAILAASQPGHPSQTYTQEFRYALTGNPIESTAGGSTASIVIDTDGRPQSRTGAGDRRLFTYYEDGTLHTITRRDELGNIVGSEFRDYDRDGRIVVHSTGIQPLQGSVTRFKYGPE